MVEGAAQYQGFPFQCIHYEVAAHKTFMPDKYYFVEKEKC